MTIRQRYLVDRNYQLRLILQIVVLSALAASISTLATFMQVNSEISIHDY